MKKTLLVLATGLLVCTCGALAVSSNASAVEVHADSISSAEIDVTGQKTYSASAGTFVSIPNWRNSGLGFSMEFKVADVNAMNNQAIRLLSNGSPVVGVIYLVNGVGTEKNGNISSVTENLGPGRATVIDAAEGWIRYELLFADVPSAKITSGMENVTIDSLYFEWYTPILTKIRNVQVISEYRTVGDTPILFGQTNNANYWKGYGTYREFPTISNWATSTEGFSFEFRPTVESSSGGMALRFQNSSWANITSAYTAYPNPGVGKTVAVGDGWYRHEIMMSDLVAKKDSSASDTDTISIANNKPWGASYDVQPDIRNAKIIKAYSATYESEVKAYADDATTKLGAVCVADGSTDKSSLSSAVAEVKTAYDGLSGAAKVLNTYSGKIVNAATKTSVDGANERLAYIHNKYNDIAVFTSAHVAKASYVTSIFGTSNNNEGYFIAAISGVALLAAGSMVFLRKKHD